MTVALALAVGVALGVVIGPWLSVARVAMAWWKRGV